MFDKNVFAFRIKSLRVEKGISQSALASFLGVTKTQISDIENAKTSTSIERLIALADYFDVSTDFLLGRTDNPNSHKS